MISPTGVTSAALQSVPKWKKRAAVAEAWE